LTLRDNEVASQLNRSEYLFLRHISEPCDNSLRVVVEAAIVDRAEVLATNAHPAPLAELRKDAWPIRSKENCSAFELNWNRYVAYLVTEESVGSGGRDEEESYTGRLFRLYTQSHFLDHLSRDTGGHTKRILHYKVICQNHLIDVASYDPPEILLSNRLIRGMLS